MPPIIQMIDCSRLLILTWIITWVTAVPQFHTHFPDLNDGPTPRQGLAHTVFSPHVPGEFSYPHRNVLHVSNRRSNSLECGFFLSTDSKSRNVGEPSILGILCDLSNKPFLSWAIESHVQHRQLLLIVASQGPRAPPSIFPS